MNKINIIENFIGRDTCDFINNSISNKLIETDDELILAGPCGWIGQHRYTHVMSDSDKNFMVWPNKIDKYQNDINYNIAIDLLSLIFNGMVKTVSDYYEEEYVMRSFFCGVMLPGSNNALHMDNYYLNSDTNLITEKKNLNWDKSGILYLNEEYLGGNLHFPLQNLKLKPKAGTFIFFEGTPEFPHRVEKVESGTRKNIVCFFIKKEKIDNIMSPKEDRDGPATMITMNSVYQINKMI